MNIHGLYTSRRLGFSRRFDKCRFRISEGEAIRFRKCRFRISEGEAIRFRKCRFIISEGEAIRFRKCHFRISQGRAIRLRKCQNIYWSTNISYEQYKFDRGKNPRTSIPRNCYQLSRQAISISTKVFAQTKA